MKIKDRRIKVIKNWLKSISVRNMKIFISFANFYQYFIQNFCKIIILLITILITIKLFEILASNISAVNNNKFVHFEGI